MKRLLLILVLVLGLIGVSEGQRRLTGPQRGGSSGSGDPLRTPTGGGQVTVAPPAGCATGDTLTDASETDEDGDITVADCSITVDTMRRDAISYVVKDLGAGNIGDFVYYVDLNVSFVSASAAIAVIFAVTDVATPTFEDMTNGTDGFMVYVSGTDASNFRIYASTKYAGGGANYSAFTVGTDYYLKIERNNTSNYSRCVVYTSAANRTTDTSGTTISATHVDATDRYLAYLGSRAQTGTSAENLSLVVQNYDPQ